MLIIFPLVFIPFGLYEIFTGQNIIQQDFLIQFFSHIGSIHIAVTFYFLFAYSEFPKAVRFAVEKEKGKFWFVIGFWTLFPIFFRLAQKQYFPVWQGFGVFQQGYGLLFNLIFAQHAIWQIRGMAMGYDSGKKRIDYQTDKILFSIIISLIFLGLSGAVLLKGGPLFYYKLSISIIVFFVVGYLIWQSYALDLRNRGNFLLRLILAPLLFFSQMIFIVKGIVHAYEYFYFFGHIKKNQISRISLSTLKVYLVTGFVLFCVLTPFLRYLPERIIESSFIFDIFIGLGHSFAFLHYYLDEKMFKLSNKNVREIMVPIIQR